MTYTIQDVFEMRKDGRIEDAYNAAMGLYISHHGHYTTLCMFWTALDYCKLQARLRNFETATKVFNAALEILPTMQDSDGEAERQLVDAGARIMRDRVHAATCGKHLTAINVELI